MVMKIFYSSIKREGFPLEKEYPLDIADKFLL